MGQGPLQLPISGDVLTTRDIPCFYPSAHRKDQIANCVFRSVATRDLIDGQVIQYNATTQMPELGTSSNSPRGTLTFRKQSDFYVRSNMKATFHGYLYNGGGQTNLSFDIDGFTCSLSDFGNSEHLISQNTGWELQIGSNGSSGYLPDFVYTFKRFPMQPLILDPWNQQPSPYGVEEIVDFDGEIVLETTRHTQYSGQPMFYDIAGGIPQYFLMNGWVDVRQTNQYGSSVSRFDAYYIPGRTNHRTAFGSNLIYNKVLGVLDYRNLSLTPDQTGITGRGVAVWQSESSSTPLIIGTADIDISYDMEANPPQTYLDEGYLAKGDPLNFYILDPQIFGYDWQQKQVTGRYRYGTSGSFATTDADVTAKDFEFLYPQSEENQP